MSEGKRIGRTLAGSVAIASILMLSVASVSADELRRPLGAREAPMRPWSVLIEATPGFAVFANNGAFPSYAIGVDALVRYRMFQIGAFRDATLEPRLYGLRGQATGGMIGARLFADSFRGFDAFAMAGLHQYQGVGSERLAGSFGAAGNAPFVGLRIGGTATLGSGIARLSGGLWLFALFDVSRQDVAVTRPADFGPQKADQATVGDVEIGLTMRFGIDLGP